MLTARPLRITYSAMGPILACYTAFLASLLQTNPSLSLSLSSRPSTVNADYFGLFIGSIHESHDVRYSIIAYCIQIVINRTWSVRPSERP